uniref:Uncharacterized protein n=1 Tax=Aquisalinus luteolus TaxID=1566827 RepID=A0A8J3ESW3_9PROT|nr:hypothetical protein GCM10011355_00840 [Aquisalinus luteolus]
MVRINLCELTMRQRPQSAFHTGLSKDNLIKPPGPRSMSARAKLAVHFHPTIFDQEVGNDERQQCNQFNYQFGHPTLTRNQVPRDINELEAEHTQKHECKEK